MGMALCLSLSPFVEILYTFIFNVGGFFILSHSLELLNSIFYSSIYQVVLYVYYQTIQYIVVMF